MGKILLQDFSPMQTAWLRYGAAWLTCVVLCAVLYLSSPQEIRIRKILNRKQLPWFLLMGVITFFASPYFQYSGLSRSTSTANAIIVALEPLFAVLLAWIFLREKMAWRQLLAFFFAVFGFCLLSNLRPDKWNESLNLFNTGNILLMLALPCEAMYSIISRRLGSDFSPVIIFSVALTFGFACFSFYLFFVRGETLPNFQLLQGKKLIALLWMGPVGTTISYMFWTYALRKASVAVVSLTLFIQPIQGALVGTFFLGDRLDIFQSVGAILILAALTTQSLPYLRKAPI